MRWIARWLGRGKTRGERGEALAAKLLTHQGYRILGRNLRNRYGEIDLLAEAPAPGRALVVVEVKTGTLGQAPPELRVNRQKQHRLVTLGMQVARQHNMTDRAMRFDIIAVELPSEGAKGKAVVRHIPGAFESRW